jgi:hypothetical protein
MRQKLNSTKAAAETAQNKNACHCHTLKKPLCKPKNCYPKPPLKIFTIPAQFCTMLHCRLALVAQCLCNVECCFSTKITIAPMQNGAKLHNCSTIAKTIDITQKLLSTSNPSLHPTHCYSCPAQTAQLPQSTVQPKQPEKQSIAQKLSKFVNSAQCLTSSVPKKQQEKQPKTKTVVIESQWQKPLTQHKNLTSETVNYTREASSPPSPSDSFSMTFSIKCIKYA